MPLSPDVSGMAPIWANAYILPVFDTGMNTPNAPFSLNTPKTELHAEMTNTKSTPISTPRYWAAMAKSAYQTAGPPVDDGWGDNDPNSEGTSRAWGSWGDEAVLLMQESIRDWIAAPTNTPVAGGGGGVDPDPRGDAGRQHRVQEILNHEMGHVFQLQHADGTPAAAQRVNGGVMTVSPDRKASVFGSQSLNKLRSVPKPGL